MNHKPRTAIIIAVLALASILSLLPSPVSGSHLPNPVEKDGWRVFWEITADDGLAVYNVTYNGILVLRDARLTGIVIRYLSGGCFFYDEIGADPPDPYSTTLFHQNVALNFPSTGGLNLTADADVPGYDYKQTWFFHPDGRFMALLKVGGGGCNDIHTYQIKWRFDFAIAGDGADVASVYTPDGWVPVRTERELVDSGLRDGSKSFTAWQVRDRARSFYMAPFDLPEATATAPRVLVAYSRLVGETVVYNSGTSTSSYDPSDQVVYGTTPSVGTILRDDARIKYVDSNGDNTWDPGEAVIYDTDDDFRFDAGIPSPEGEQLISGPRPVDQAVLKDEPFLTYVDSKGNNRWDTSEVESSHSPGLVNPYVYLDGERVFRTNLVLWYLAEHTHDIHREILFEEPRITGMIFYPSGY